MSLARMFGSSRPIPAVNGTRDLCSVGAIALAALPAYCESLTAKAQEEADGEVVGEAEVAEIAIWENMPITATISEEFECTYHAWNGERWVAVTYS